MNKVLEQARKDSIPIGVIETRLRWASEDPNIRKIMLSKNRAYNLSVLIDYYIQQLAEPIRRKIFDSTRGLFRGSLDINVFGTSSLAPDAFPETRYYPIYPSQRH